MARRVFADANLFLRYLTDDVPDQADTVHAILSRAGAGEIVLVVNVMVVAEIVWVLELSYALPRTEIRDKIMAIATTPGLEIADRELVLQAVTRYSEADVDFFDAYNAVWLLAQGMDAIYTFDRRPFSRASEVEDERTADTQGGSP
jgi:predicted nucleic-acid-binding protein